MSSRLRARSWQAALPKPLPAEQGCDASEARLTRVRWVKGGLSGCCTPSKRDTRLRYSPNLRNNVLILAQRVARADQLPGTTSGRRQNVLLLPRRYQATINLLKTHDKLARGRDLMAARLGRLPSRYLSERFGCGGAPVVIGTGVENSDQGGGTHASVFRADSIRGRARAGRRRDCRPWDRLRRPSRS